MTNEAQRIAAAEWDGWSQIQNANTVALGGIWVGCPPTGVIVDTYLSIPDYSQDLNAMQRLWKKLTRSEKITFYKLLSKGWLPSSFAYCSTRTL